VRISAGGGGQPRWRNDGRELYYVSGKKFMAVAVNYGAEFVASAPMELFKQETALLSASRNSYEVTPDGQRFLINVVVDSTGSAPISVVMNWAAELKR
jgi:hypothetical protein